MSSPAPPSDRTPPPPERRQGQPADPNRTRKPLSFRNRLKRDRFLFVMCISFLGFTTWAFAITWWLIRDPVMLVATSASLVPAFYLFYLRDGAPA